MKVIAISTVTAGGKTIVDNKTNPQNMILSSCVRWCFFMITMVKCSYINDSIIIGGYYGCSD